MKKFKRETATEYILDGISNEVFGCDFWECCPEAKYVILSTLWEVVDGM